MTKVEIAGISIIKISILKNIFGKREPSELEAYEYLVIWREVVRKSSFTSELVRMN